MHCNCRNRCLRLEGCVPSFYLKQLAQEAVRDLKGIDRIENQIVVASPVGETLAEPAESQPGELEFDPVDLIVRKPR